MKAEQSFCNDEYVHGLKIAGFVVIFQNIPDSLPSDKKSYLCTVPLLERLLKAGKSYNRTKTVIIF